MPEAGSASLAARVRADTILGIRRPRTAAHERMMRVETWLRFAVPGMLAGFLLCLLAVIALHLRLQHAEVVRAAHADIEGFARLGAAALGERGAAGEVVQGSPQARLDLLMPAGAHPGRQVFVAGRDDRIVAAYPIRPRGPATLTGVLGTDQVLTSLAEAA